MNSIRARRTRAALTCSAGLCAVFVAITAAPAAAHGNPGNFVIEVTEVRPPVLGLGITADADGSALTLSNRTGRVVIVLGDRGEQFLKITSEGTWRNVDAATPVVVVGDDGPAPPSPSLSTTQPHWQRVSNSSTYRYHDHRIDWMGRGIPDVVKRDVNAFHLIRRWAIDLVVDGTPVRVLGTLSWKPTGFSRADVAFVLVCTLMIVVVVLAIVRDRRRQRSLTDRRG